MTFSVSIIIPSFQGQAKLPHILESLKNQTYSNFEVIVAIDGSTDDSFSLSEKLIFDFNLQGKVVYQENRGRAAIRNYGAKKANGDLLIFFDDDMRPTKDCVEQHVLHHVMSKNAILVGRQIEDLSQEHNEIFEFKHSLSIKWEKNLQSGPLKRPYLTAANCSMSKIVFNQLGGFNENLIDAEDFELACRAFQQGITIYFNPNCLAWHDDYITLAKYVKRQIQYKGANKIVFDLHPKYRVDSIDQQSGLKKSLFFLISLVPFIQLADAGVFSFLPNTLKFKLFDLFITSKTYNN